MTLPYPSNFEVGNAKGAGDCFFDSVAQGLRQLRPHKQYGVRFLRKKCAEYVKEHQYTDKWICRALEYEKQNVDSYLKDVIHCAEDFNKVTIPVGMDGAMWGRPEIEGRIICKIFTVKLHVIEKYTVGNTIVWAHQLVDKNGSKSVNNVDYESNSMISIVNKGAEHFEPLLETHVVNSSHVTKHDDLEGTGKEYEHNQTKQVSTKEIKFVESVNAEIVGTSLELTQNMLQDNGNVTQQENRSSTNPNLSLSSNFATAVDYNAQNQIHVIHCNEQDSFFKPIIKRNMKLKSHNNSENLVQSDHLETAALDSEGVPTFADVQGSEQDMIQNDETIQGVAGTKDQFNSAAASQSNNAREICDEQGKTNNVISKPVKYRKTKGTVTSDESGIIYEERLFMLILLRGLATNITFHLGHNVEEAGKFDDVVFKVETIKDGKKLSQTVFIQAKYTNNYKKRIGHNKFSENSDYCLKMLFDAYLKIKENVTKQTDPIFTGDIKDCYFILYTNQSLHSEVTEDPTIYDADVVKMVNSGSGNIVQFKENGTMIKELCGEKENRADEMEFLQHFYLFVNQPILSKLSDNIKKEMEPICGNDWNVDIVFKQALQLLPFLCKKSYYCTEYDQIFVDAVHRIKVNETKNKKIKIQFANEKIKELLDLVKEHQAINIVADGAKLLGRVLVFQAFKRKSEWNIKSSKSIFMELDKLMSMKEKVLLAFKIKNLLVIEGNFENEHATLLKELSCIMRGNDNKKLILVTDCDDLQPIFEKYRTLHMGFKDLTAESQKLILKKKVNFQGKTIDLRNLIDRDDFARDVISLKTLMQLYYDEDIVISNEPLRFHKMYAAHAKFPLKLQANNFVHLARKCLDGSAFFLVFETQKNEVVDFLSQNPEDADFVKESIFNNIIIDTNKDKEYMLDKFEQFCEQNSKENVYWFTLAHGQFELEKLYDPNFYAKRKFNFPVKIRIAKDLLCQRNLNQSGTFMCSSGKEEFMQMFENYKTKNSISHFETQCQKRRIIFESSADRAKSTFNSLSDKINAVFWLKIDRTMNFVIRRSNDPFQTLISRDQGNVEPYVLIKEEQPDTVFIFAENDNKQQVQNIIETCLGRQRERFNENCNSGKIVFRDEYLAEGNCKSNEPEHWVQIDGEDLVWLRSNGSLDGLRDYASIDYDIFNEEDFSNDAECKCVIFSADPGMGKLTTLTSLSERMKETNWVIYIKFKECTDAINALPSDTKKHFVNFERICDFFSEVGGTGMLHDLEKQLFVHKLKQEKCKKRPILILFDAFDEINDEQRQKITPLLKFLNFQTSARLWITTRETRTQELENALATFATRFRDLDENQPEEFLYNYWRVRVNVSQIHNADDNLRKRAIKLLEYLKRSPGGTRLQLILLQLQILAEGFQNAAESNTDPKFDRITIIDVYKRFIDGRYSVYFSEKTGLVEHSMYVQSTLLKSLNKDHQYLGFHEAFPNETKLSYRHKFPSKEEVCGLISVGIIQSSGREGNIYFIHKSFAEYFAADLLVENLQKRNKCPLKYRLTIQILSQEMLLEANKVIRHFVDRMLCKHSPVHLAAFEGDILKFIAALKDNHDDTEVVDELGRTPLHLAVQERNVDIIDYLTSKGCNDSILDVFNKNPFDYLMSNELTCVNGGTIMHSCQNV